MNKKICGVMLSLFAFGVYADQQVTEDMLIGNWHCEYVDSKFVHQLGFEESPVAFLKNFDVSYVRKNEQLYEIKKDGKNEEKLMRFSKYLTLKIPSEDGSTQKVEQQYNYVSNDEFNEITKIQNFSSNNKHDDYTLNMTLNCKRDK